MKNKIITLLFGITLVGCSSDDNSDNNNIGGDANNYLPQQQGNYWVYDVNSEEFSGRDSLYVSGTTTSQGDTYYTYETYEAPFGFYSGLMTSGQSRSSESKIFMNGMVGLGDLFGEGLDFDIELDDFVIFDGNASQGQVLDSESGSFTIPYSPEVDLEVEYTLFSKAGQNYSNYTLVNGDYYDDVKSTTLAISAKITANIVVSGFPFSAIILETQEILNSTQYYASSVGVIAVNTNFQYQLNEIPLPGYELPLPQNYQSNTTEVLDDYLVE